MAASSNPSNGPTAPQIDRTWSLGRDIVFDQPQARNDTNRRIPDKQASPRALHPLPSEKRRVSPPRLPSTALFPTQSLRRSLYTTGCCAREPAQDPHDGSISGNNAPPQEHPVAVSIRDSNKSAFEHNTRPHRTGGSFEDVSDYESSLTSEAACNSSQDAYLPSQETGNPPSGDSDEAVGVIEDDSQELTQDPSSEEQGRPVDALPFHIPSDVMQQALASQSTDNPTHWTHELYRDDAGHRPAVHYCRTLQASEQYARSFLEEPVLGFDLEWSIDHKIKRNIKHEVSVIQIASPTRILISHVAVMYGSRSDELLAPSIRKILESPNIIKTGVWIKGDCTKMRNNFDVDVCSMFELSHLHKLVTLSASAPHLVNRKLVPLKEVVQTHLQLPMAKGAVRVSAWDRTLDMEQIKYAAADAYAGVVLFYTLDAKRKAMKPCPPRPHMAETNLPIKLADGVSSSKPVEEGEDALDEEDQMPEHGNSDLLMRGLTKDVAKLKLAERRVNEVIGIENDAGTPTKARRSTSSTPRKPPRTSTSNASPKRIDPPELVEANAWAEQHATSRLSPAGQPSNQRASASQLRAYHLWHHQELSASVVAATLRDPPLKTATAAGYIVQAVHFEELPFDEDRLSVLAKDVGFMPWVIRESKLVGPLLKAGSKR